jgi:hypothetical protein
VFYTIPVFPHIPGCVEEFDDQLCCPFGSGVAQAEKDKIVVLDGLPDLGSK